ncbi:MAG: hypothetical protein JNJ60_13465 [Rhodocyclaceae bacterium]|nr:hypothetical protein [Rhodocyclaceae bacterium]
MRLEPRQYGFEVLGIDAETEMLDRKRRVGFEKVQRQAVIDIDRRKRAERTGLPGLVQQFSQQARSA